VIIEIYNTSFLIAEKLRTCFFNDRAIVYLHSLGLLKSRCLWK